MKLNKDMKYTVSCSFLQIYNEKIYDLLEVFYYYKLGNKHRTKRSEEFLSFNK